MENRKTVTYHATFFYFQRSFVIKKLLILFLLMNFLMISQREVRAFDFYFGEAGAPGPDEVHIGQTAIMMPLEIILLARKDKDYCAIKFDRFWSENPSKTKSRYVQSGADEYATYESYYQGDKTGDFTKENVKFHKEKLSNPKARGIGRFAFSFGNRNIKCGSINIKWVGGRTGIYFKKSQAEDDYGIELAPTKWTDISEVNVFDPRLKWYRYDTKRKRENIPIDKLWDETKPSSLPNFTGHAVNERR